MYQFNILDGFNFSINEWNKNIVKINVQEVIKKRSQSQRKHPHIPIFHHSLGPEVLHHYSNNPRYLPSKEYDLRDWCLRTCQKL